MFKKYAYIAIFITTCLFLVWISTLPDHYRKQGYEKAQSEYKLASEKLELAAAKKYAEKSDELIKAKEDHEKDKIKLNADFENYIDDMRRNHAGGLRIAKSRICTSDRKEVTSPQRIEDKETARLPREIEENLFRFAHDRDKIITDFEQFKQEVRIAKCFAE